MENYVSHIDRDSNLVPTFTLYTKRAQKSNNGLCQLCLGESCPSSFCPDARQFTSALYVPVPFKLLPYHSSSEGVSARKFVCSPLRGTAWDSTALHLTKSQYLMVFTAGSYGHFSSWHLNPRVGGLVWGWNPPSGGNLCSWGIPSNFYPLGVVVGSTHSESSPLLSVSIRDFLFISLVVGLPFVRFQVVLNDGTL